MNVTSIKALITSAAWSAFCTITRTPRFQVVILRVAADYCSGSRSERRYLSLSDAQKDFEYWKSIADASTTLSNLATGKILDRSPSNRFPAPIPL